MTYKIDIDPVAMDQIKALPPGTEQAMAEVLTVLELIPKNGAPYNKAKPDGNMRVLVSGAGGRGKVVYLILEEQRRVDVLEVIWVG